MINTHKFKRRQLWQLAWPMILANISTPLLGLVDTAVMGHLDSPKYLGAVALGGLIFGFIYWGFGFLRMGTTGLVAQAFGLDARDEIRTILARSVILALAIACLLLMFQAPLSNVSFWLMQADPELERLAEQYFSIRIYSAPATLSLYALSGWFLGVQNVKIPMIIVLTTNVLNIVLDIGFVIYLKMELAGVAWATVLAEYAGLCIGLLLLGNHLRSQAGRFVWRNVLNFSALAEMLSINGNIFVRTLCLIFTFAFFTEQSARYGEVVLAANTVLLNFQTFMAYVLDGFAHAVEALVGKAKGAKDVVFLKKSVRTGALWSAWVAIGFSLAYLIFGASLVDLLTGIPEVRAEAYRYLFWVTILPLISFTSFLLDGVFIGMTLSHGMRNTMMFSLLGVFLPVWYWSLPLGNIGLWLSFLAFMAARGLSMSCVFLKYLKTTPFLK